AAKCRSRVPISENRVFETCGLVDVAASLRKRRECLPQRIHDRAPPLYLVGGASNATIILTAQRNGMGIERQFATKHRTVEDVIVIDRRIHIGVSLVEILRSQTAEMIDIRGEVIPVVQAFKKEF